MDWSRPLDGIEDVAWGEFERGVAVAAALASLARATPEQAGPIADDIDQLLEHCNIYQPAAVPAVGVLARIAAAHPCDEASEQALRLIDGIAFGWTDGATDEERQARRAELRTVLVSSVPALREAARVVPGVRRQALRQVEQISTGVLPGGVWDPRWRGVARAFIERDASRVWAVTVAGRSLLLLSGSGGPAALWDPATGERAGPARPHDGYGSRAHADGDGGRSLVLTEAEVAAASRGLPETESRALLRAAGHARPSRWRSWFRLFSRAGSPLDRMKGARVPFESAGRPCVAIGVSGALRRFDATTGEEIGPELAFGDGDLPPAVCAYQQDGRPILAVGAHRQIHRLDAETGEPAGPLLDGHPEEITGIAVASVGGRPTLYAATSLGVFRWDAWTGTPWPAESDQYENGS
ncbi:WD40 repeat domain-containing protein [Actinoplanes awajinensis]|uniref:Uncharacterized protein n=1 Tax=Actinoplanes awajinensis subsp. mycoplanecinus TaxID=135947 RepID=A0A0X3UQ00_9ACTN|nr:hypothetical protein [Actinoplanes awajinensis]KUL34227.1 hypothetical protein ADL15_16455 [Actinoplanes awajinensis subsp. mycoplanecinus]